MVNLIKPAFFKASEDSSLRVTMCLRLQRPKLFLIMLIDKRFYGFDGCENRLPSGDSREESG